MMFCFRGCLSFRRLFMPKSSYDFRSKNIIHLFVVVKLTSLNCVISEEVRNICAFIEEKECLGPTVVFYLTPTSTIKFGRSVFPPKNSIHISYLLYQCMNLSEILRDETINDKFMYIPNDDE